MAGYAAATVATLKILHVLLASLQSYLGMGNHLCPVSTPIDTIISKSYDYIIIGAGEAGSVVAYRMAETNASVLVLEAGGCPPIESNMAGYFTMLPLSGYDYAMNTHNDSLSCQKQKLEGGITSGKMLGGSGSLSHMIYVSPQKEDFDPWGEAANDASWTYEEFIHYFAKGENVQHKGVLEQNTTIHGTDGPAILTKQESSSTVEVIEGYAEIGLPYKEDSQGQCVVQPLLALGDGMRQCGNVAVSRKLKDKTHVSFLTGAVVTKIIIDGETATGVEFSYSGSSYSVSATSKVIVSAGAIKTPQLLMLSGIGDRDTLERFGIKLVAENKDVGQNLMDHATAVFAIALNKNTNIAPAANPSSWPAPMVVAFAALTPEETMCTRQDIMLRFPPNSTGFLQLCTYGFKYLDEICDAWYEYNINRDIFFVASNLVHPKSRGFIELESEDINVQPKIQLNLLSDSTDLELFAEHMFSLTKIIKTKALQNLGAELADVGVCTEYENDSLEFWRCYVREMSSTMWHFSGTCAIGKVVDNNLSVLGVKNLKLIDASIFPSPVSGKIGSTVRAVAEKGADIIKTEDGLCNVNL